MSTYEEKKALRDQGLTYREIGKRLGISHQAVAHTLAQRGEGHFVAQKYENIIYAGLKEWMIKNKITYTEIIRLMGNIPNPEAQTRMRKMLTGKRGMTKNMVDRLLAVCELPYETAFARVQDDG